MNIKENAKNIDVWTRGLFILIYAVITYIILLPLIWLMVIFQFLIKLITSKLNNPLLDFSASLSRYALQILSYITFMSEERPFPFSPWPTDDTKEPPKITAGNHKISKKKTVKKTSK